VDRRLLDRLDDRELVALCGHELGQVQNNHLLYTTALHYLRHEAMFFVRWIVQPAVMTLQSWSRRAEITCDRAALIASRDLEVTLSSMVKVVVDDPGLKGDARTAIADLESAQRGVGRLADLFRSHPLLPKRARALEVFAESALYRKLAGHPNADGLSSEEVDARVSDIIRVLV
jgi:Zn-dependent protease with chaperone function